MAEEWETKADVAFLPKAEGSRAGGLLGAGRHWVIMETFSQGSWHQHRLRLCTEPIMEEEGMLRGWEASGFRGLCMEMPKSMRLSFGQQNPTSNNTGNFVYRGQGLGVEER